MDMEEDIKTTLSFWRPLMKKALLMITLIFAISLTGCIGPGLGDTETKVAGNCYLVKSGKLKASLMKEVSGTKEGIIPNTVTGLYVYEDYIFARQQPYDLEKKKLVKSETHYFVLHHSSGEMKGPLSLTEFKSLLERMDVKTKVKFENDNIVHVNIN
ncbi:hypothetical protein BIV59_04585 [Bacillus sp. MUM 13]|nr:hypothetical protein BIV59_04585 [Bacillus sp. MUM 13]